MHVGQRLSYSNDLCTVRYVGPVKGTAGDWLGVEWDDAERGKHDGKHNGIRYFECRTIHPAAASFIRPSRPTDSSRELVQAVKDKYASELVNGISTVHFDKVTDAISISGKEVEEVGFEKIRKQLSNLKQLRIVVLDTLRIHRDVPLSDKIIQDNEDLAATCPNVMELDLSRNLFEIWFQIVDICRQLPKLNSLRVDGNRLSDTRTTIPGNIYSLAPFTSLKVLSLNDTLMPWSDVAAIARTLPALSTLSANGNEYQQLSHEDLPDSIENLSLERNLFQSLDAFKTVARFRNLHTLNLRQNPIQRLSQDSSSSLGNEDFAFSPSLVELNVPYCAIDSWSLIDTLGRICPGLKSLRVAHNPLYDALVGSDGKLLTPDDGYMLTIARLGGLQRLNFSTISPKERLNAELYYLSQVNQELSLTSSDEKSVIATRHPRFEELRRIYNQENQLQPIQTRSTVDPRSLAASLVTLNFQLDVGLTRTGTKDEETPENVAWDCEIPKSFSIYKVIGLVSRRFKLTPMSVQLQLESPEDDVVYEDADSELSSEDDDHTVLDARKGTVPPPEQRGQILTPLMRPLGTFLDDGQATVRVIRKQSPR